MVTLRLLAERWRIELRGKVLDIWHDLLLLFAEDDAKQLIWHRKPLSTFWLYVFICFLWYWETAVPSPGKAVAALAVAAAAMSVRGEMRGKEKVAWLMVLFAFLSVELASIDKEREASEVLRVATRQQETENFRDIGNGIEKSIRQSQADFNITMKSLDENMKMTTGGDSFCYLDFLNRSSKESAPLIIAVRQGQYPLRDVAARFVDQEKYNGPNSAASKMTVEQIAAGDRTFEIGTLTGVKLLTRYPLAGRERWNFLVEFNGLNGFWHELIRLRKVDGEWEQAVKVGRYEITSKNKPATDIKLLEKIDKQYPRVNGKVDWTD